MRFLLLLLMFFSIVHINAQTKINVDSLKIQLASPTIKNDSIKVEILIDLIKHYEFINKDSTSRYTKALIVFGREKKNARGIFYGSLYSSYTYFFSGQYEKALTILKPALEEIKPLNDPETSIYALNKISQIYGALRLDDSAIYYNSLSLDLSIKSNSSLGKLMSYSEIGSYFYSNQLLDSAMKYYILGKKECGLIQKTNNYCASLDKKIAKIYIHRGEIREAITQYKEAQTKFLELNNTKAYFTTNNRIANAYLRIGEYEKASSKLDSSYVYFKEKEYYPDLITCLFEKNNLFLKQKKYKLILQNCKEIERLRTDKKIKIRRSLNMDLGKAYYRTNDFKQAIQYLEKAYNIAVKKKKNYAEVNALFYLSKAHKKEGNYREATTYYDLYIKAYEIKQTLKNNKYTKELEAEYETEKKEQEIKLLKANKELDKQRQKRKSNLLIGGIILISLVGLLLFFLFRNRQKTSKKLKEIDTIKTRFFENISHEFRTPLTLIKLPLSQAINNKEKLDLKELNLMHNNASRLQNLIEDLLSLSELEAGKMIIKKSEQDPLLQSKTLSSQFDSYAESKGINYHKVIERNSIKATYDKSVVDKVLANLISNAIKYSETGGEVQVSVALVDQKLVMKVSDQGDGITPENQEKIFDRFYRVDETDEGKQGSGIGLALVKKLLEINNGTIDLTSKINEGSTFTATIRLENIIQLPFEPIPEIAKEKKQLKLKKEDLLDVIELSDKPKLLIAEDNKELLEYISTLFKDDFQLINATDGNEGMKKALEYVPDFIISDWMMPNKNGLEFCKEIKTNSVTSHIPFLLLTAKSMVEDKIEGYETGADAYFSKPFNFNELKARINSLLKQRQLLYEKYSDTNIQLSSSTNNSLDIEFWKTFKSYLTENIKESELLSTAKFSEHMGMSRMQLHRKLVALTGKNLSAFIKNQKMNLACELLKDNSLRISDVCYEIGYEDKSAFARVFKQEYGITPTQFRKNLEKN